MQTQKELFYGISLQLDVPFELYVDDIPLAKVYSEARTIMGVDLNPYVLGPGTHQLSIKLLPTVEDGKAMVRPRDVKLSKLKLVRYEKQREPGMGRAKNSKILRKLHLLELDQPVPTATVQWKIKLPNLPYRLEGWSRGQDLRKMDRDELKQEVVAFYEKIRNLLNRGQVEKYMQLLDTFYDETNVFSYTSNQQANKDEAQIKQDILEEAKGNMQPIEKYKMIIYANGLLVTLERKDKANLGESALRTLEPDGTETFYTTFLYIPKGADSLEVIR